MPEISLLAIVAALLGAAAGYFGGSWFVGRKLAATRLQLKSLRQSTADHLAQMKRQIAQLQGEIATRPTSKPTAARPGDTAKAVEAAAQARREAAEKLLAEGDNNSFKDTRPHGFARTEVLPEIPAR